MAIVRLEIDGKVRYDGETEAYVCGFADEQEVELVHGGTATKLLYMLERMRVKVNQEIDKKEGGSSVKPSDVQV